MLTKGLTERPKTKKTYGNWISPNLKSLKQNDPHLMEFKTLPKLFLITCCRQTAKFMAPNINIIISLNLSRFNGKLKQI